MQRFFVEGLLITSLTNCFRRRWFVLIACIAFSVASYAQESYQHFVHLSTQDGLANNVVYDIVQDHEGYIWIASAGGLQRYDGRIFITYTPHTFHIPRTVRDLYCDRENTLWIMSAGGIFRYERASNSFIEIKSASGQQSFQRFFEDNAGMLGVLDNKGGLFFLNDQKDRFEYYTVKWPGNTKPFRAVGRERRSGIFWISDGHHLLRYDPKSSRYENYDLQHALRSSIANGSIDTIEALYLDRNENLWLAFKTRNRAWKAKYSIATDTWTVSKAEEDHITNFITTKTNLTWSIGSTLSLYNSKSSWNEVKSFAELPYAFSEVVDSVYCVAEDRDGANWVGTDNGLFVFAPSLDKFTYWPLKTKPQRFYRLGDRFIFVLNSDHSASVFNEQFDEAHRFGKIAASVNNDLIPACAGQQNDVWLVNKNKVMRVTSAPFRIHQSRLEIPNDDPIISIASDRKNRLWMAGASGCLYACDLVTNRVTTAYRVSSKQGSSQIIQIIPDEESNTLWLVYADRIDLVALDGSATLSTNLQGMVAVQALNPEAGKLLVGTRSGIHVVAKSSNGLTISQANAQLQNENVTGVVEDRSKRIWITTLGNGLFRMSPSWKEIKHFNENDGLVYSDFSPAANLVVNNRVILATRSKVLSFDPEDTPSALYNPRVQIVSFRVNGIETPIKKIDQGLELNWRQNTIGIEFSSMSRMYKDRVEFAYRLEGHDREWIVAREGERIKFANLAPGQYIFRVQTKAVSGNVIADEASVSFNIKAAFWTTVLFKVGVSLFLLSVIIIVLIRRKQKQKRIQQIKDKISRDLHDHIGSSLSAINLLVDVVRTCLPTNPQKASDLLRKIAFESHVTQENLHDIVWSMAPGNATMQKLTDRMKEFAFDMFGQQAVTLHLAIDESVSTLALPLDKRYDLYLLFKEVVNNGAKYSQASEVDIQMGVKENTLRFDYRDNGIGFDPERTTGGNGLRNMLERAKSLSGVLEVYSAPGQGTRIALRCSKLKPAGATIID